MESQAVFTEAIAILVFNKNCGFSIISYLSKNCGTIS